MKTIAIPTRYGFNIILSGQALWLVSSCDQCWYNNKGKCPVHGTVRQLWPGRSACWKFEAVEEAIDEEDD